MELGLNRNQFGDQGLRSLADAVANGGMANLKHLFALDNAKHPELMAACQARGINLYGDEDSDSD